MGKDQQGICICCRKSQICWYRENTAPPIFMCEEFEGYGPCKPALSRQTAQATADCQSGSPVDEEHATGQNGLLGLCRDCKWKDMCTYTKPACAVWHCEEYQMGPLRRKS